MRDIIYIAIMRKLKFLQMIVPLHINKCNSKMLFFA